MKLLDKLFKRKQGYDYFVSFSYTRDGEIFTNFANVNLKTKIKSFEIASYLANGLCKDVRGTNITLLYWRRYEN